MLSGKSPRAGSLSHHRGPRRVKGRSARTRLSLRVEALESRQLLSGLVVNAGSAINTAAGATAVFAGSVSGGTAPYVESWSFGDGTSAPVGGTVGATFAGTDGVTQGNWIGNYGSAGYDLAGIGSSLPSYAAVTPSGQSSWTWASSTTDQRALEVPGGATRVAACWDNSTSFSVGVNLTDGQVHPVSLYAVDYDSTARAEQIQVINAATGAVLDTESLSNFHGGEYLTWDVSGDVTFRLTRTAGANAVLSGVFVGSAAGPAGTPHIYANPGTYTATLSANDAAGATGSASTTVTVADVAPTVSVTAPSSAMAGSPAAFAATARDISPAVQAAGFTYNWSFGDGTTGTGADPGHDYTSAGTYTVSVTATDQYGDTSTPTVATLVITATTSLPTFRFDFGPTGYAVAPGYKGVDNNAYSPSVGYGWENSSGVYAGGNWWPNYNPLTSDFVDSGDATFLVDLPDGTYTVVPTLGRFDASQSQVAISIDGQQVASGLSTAPEQYISPAYQVDVTGGQLALRVQNTGGHAFWLNGLSILPGRVQPPTTSAGAAMTSIDGTAASFGGATATGAGLLNYAWTFGDGTTATGVLNPSHVYSKCGDYTAMLTVTDADGLVVASETNVNVTTASSPPVGSSGASLTVDAGSPAAFIGATESGGSAPFSYLWSFGDGSQQVGSLNPSHTYVNPGTYTAILTVTDANSLSSSSSTTVTVNDVAPTVSLTAPSSGTAGSAVDFNAVATDVSPVVQAAGFTYNWNFGDGATGTGATPSHVYSAAGTYSVSVTATDSHGKTSMQSAATIVILAAVSTGTVNMDANWLQQHGAGPYNLDQANTTYVLQADVSTVGTAFIIDANNVTLNLNGHTVTYDNGTPMSLTNGGFETGDFTGWNVNGSPSAQVVPARPGMYGSFMAQLSNITGTQSLLSSPIAIPAVSIGYAASIATKSFQGNATVTVNIVDATNPSQILASSTLTSNGVASGAMAVCGFTPTTTNPVRVQIVVNVPSGKSDTVLLDEASLVRAGVYGINFGWNKNTATITSTASGARLVQGQGGSASSPAVNATYGMPNLKINNLYISAYGRDTNLISVGWTNNVTITNNTLVAGVDQISNRQAAAGMMVLTACSGTVDIENNNLSGTHQNGIEVIGLSSVTNPTFKSVIIKNNTVSQNDLRWTDGYALGLQGVNNFEVSGNNLTPVSGRGIMLQGTSSPERDLSNGSIHDNYVEAQEAGSANLEYGASGLEVTALRVRNYGAAFVNLQIYNNTFYAHTGIGQDWAAIGARFTIMNNTGLMNNSNFVVRDNVMKAIVDATDPGLKYQDAYALDLARFDAGTGILFQGNTLESNDISLNFGSNDGINESDITLIGNTLVKSSQGITTIRSNDTTVRGYVGIEAGGFGSTVQNIRLIATSYANGATSYVKFVGPGAKSLSFGSLLNVDVVDGNSNPVAGATVTILDQNGNQVYTGVTNAQGVIANIPLVTTTLLVPAGGDNYNPTTVGTNPFTIKATSGSLSATQTKTLSGDGNATLTLQ